jgi:phosphoribosylanthranilate isomerase
MDGNETEEQTCRKTKRGIMGKMIVQIYEIQTPREAERCIELGVDHIGSVLLSEANWRQPQLRETVKVSQGSDTKNSVIPLFQDWDTLCRCLDYYSPHFIHFCESLVDKQGLPVTPGPLISLQARIKERYPEMGIIRSLPVPQKGLTVNFPCIDIAQEFEAISDLFLVDTWLGQEPVEGFIGITGKTCDWRMARDLVLASARPVILAGGLSPENVYAALMDVAPAGADSCTYTNKVDGRGNPVRFKKDFVKVKKFVNEVRRAEQDGQGRRG